MLSALWPKSFVTENNLSQHIFLLRKALSHHESRRKIIETVPGRGYRFAVPVDSGPELELEERVSEVVAGSVSEPLTLICDEVEKPEPNGLPAHGQPPEEASRRLGTPVPVVEEGVTAWSGWKRPADHKAASPAMRWALWTSAAMLVLALYPATRWMSGPSPSRITAYTQITTDGRAKSIGGTDGSRVYFTQLESSGIAQVSVSGGAEAPVELVIKDPWSGKISPDGSTMLIISQAGGQGPADSLWSFRLVGGALRRLGNAISAAWSPDGQKIVYASANGDLVVIRRDGSEEHRIASPGGFVNSIAWSPDGDTIRLSRDGLLWQVLPVGDNLRPLLPGWGQSPTQSSGEWMPDGQFVFVADGQLWLLENGHGFGLKATARPVQLTFGPTVWDRPIPSPDGKKIFASGRTRRGELVRFDRKSAQFKSFLAGISAEFVSFSSDSKSVAYVSYPDGVLWRANPDGSHPVQLTEPPVHPKSLRWSPDGLQIAFVNRTADNVDEIFLIAADGTGKPHRMAAEDGHAATDPSWSPDGQKIAFSTSPNVGASAESELRIFDLATGKAAAIPVSDGLLVPRWSPDGRAIAAMTLDTESLRLFNVSTGHWTKLDTGPVAFPEWSHDGRWIDYVRWTADPALLRIRVADRNRETVADLKGARYTGTYTLWMGLDPADNPMMLRDEGTDDIYALTLARQ